jgi:methylglutaconyl-CoA hydratase
VQNNKNIPEAREPKFPSLGGAGGGLSFSPSLGGGRGEALRGGFVELHIQDSLARINLNRPERHNAIVPEMLVELNEALDEIAGSEELLFVVLSGNGQSFCAGADLHWFSGAEERTLEQNAAQYKQFADLLFRLYQLPQITIAAVRGNVFGGGIGLMSVCDFVLAESNSRFMFSEVKLGLLPATILPFVARRLSVQNLRKWILTGNPFTAADAHQAGLVDRLADNDQLESSLYEFMASFEAVSPSAAKKAKQMINHVVTGNINIADTEVTSTILAEALLSPDGKEGVRAFQEKRKPIWKK